MRLLFICGSRDYPSLLSIKREIVERKPDFVMDGAGSGTDSFATSYARAAGIHAIEIGALWNEFGKSAGPRRNKAMATILEALKRSGWDITALAFSVMPVTTGTSDMVDRLRGIGIEPEIIEQ